MNQKNQEWEKDFDEKFDCDIFSQDLYDPSKKYVATEVDKTEVKQFIRTLLKKEREKAYEEGLNLRKAYNDPELLAEIKSEAQKELKAAILARIADEKEKGYEAQTILEGLEVDLKFSNLL